MCGNTDYSASYVVSKANFKLVRSGTWTSHDGSLSATATEIDLMSPVRHRMRYRHGLFVSQVCGSAWGADLSSPNSGAGLVRAGTEDLSGSQTATQLDGSTSQAPCHAHAKFTTSFTSQPFGLQLDPRFGARQRHVNAIVKVQVPFGLACATPLGESAQFDFPALSTDTLPSDPVRLSPRRLEQDRPFTLRFSGSSTVTRSWNGGFGKIGTTHYVVTWSGAITFKPTGCEEAVISTGQLFHRCYPG